jgi:hypothetical protein
MNPESENDCIIYCKNGYPLWLIDADDIDKLDISLETKCAAWDEKLGYCRMCGARPKNIMDDDLK